MFAGTKRAGHSEQGAGGVVLVKWLQVCAHWQAFKKHLLAQRAWWPKVQSMNRDENALNTRFEGHSDACQRHIRGISGSDRRGERPGQGGCRGGIEVARIARRCKEPREGAYLSV